MCNRYISPETAEAERFWKIDERRSRRNAKLGILPLTIFPRSQAPFIRRAKDETDYEREMVIGRWGLIPWFSDTAEPKAKDGRALSTNNARAEELSWKRSYKDPWLQGKRCIIPAASFDEPNWESGKNQWWQFKRADGAPWGLAGLWNTWADKATGEVHESFTMLTLNADEHPLMSRMHKPDPKLPADKQDKRSVIPIEAGDVDLWLAGTIEEAKKLLKLAPVEEFDAGPITV